VPESRSAVTFRPSIVAGIKASSRFLPTATLREVNDRKHGVLIAATMSGMSELESLEVSGKLVLTLLAQYVWGEKSFFCARALDLAKQTFWKCPRLPQLKQQASLAGHGEREWILPPQK